MIASAIAVGAGIAAGAAVGFLLGVIIMAAWERFSDPRVADIGHAYASTGIPTSSFDDITQGRAVALIERWLALSTKPSTRVALIPTNPKLEPVARDAAAWLADLHDKTTAPLPGSSDGARADGAGVSDPATNLQAVDGSPEPTRTAVAAAPADQASSWRRWQRPQRQAPVPDAEDTGQREAVATEYAGANAQPPPASSLVVVATGSSDPEATPEGEAMRSDVLVLLVPADTRGKDLMESVWTLEHFGHRPEWILLVDSTRKSRRLVKREASKAPS